MRAARPSFLPTLSPRGKVGRVNSCSYNEYKLGQAADPAEAFRTAHKGLTRSHYDYLGACNSLAHLGGFGMIQN